MNILKTFFWISLLKSKRIVEFIEVIMLIVSLNYIGIRHFSSLSKSHIKELHLRAGMEQLYLIEQCYYGIYGTYFDPRSANWGLNWSWMDYHDWQIRLDSSAFWIVVSTDLNNDGRIGVWAMDQTSPVLTNLSDD